MFSFSPKRRRRKNKEEFRVFKWSSWTTSFPERLCGAVFNELPVNNVFFFFFLFSKREVAHILNTRVCLANLTFTLLPIARRKERRKDGAVFSFLAEIVWAIALGPVFE
jgi:hypothetical protein